MTAARPIALVVALNNLRYDSRVLAEAASLHEAGYDVTAVGIMQLADDEPTQSTPFGRILRVLTSQKALARTLTDASVVDDPTACRPSRRGLIGDARVFFGRLREDWRVFRATKDLRPDVVIVCDLDALPIGSLFRRRTGAAVVYDVHELWTDQPGHGGRLLKALFRLQERLLIGRVDAVVTVNTELARVLAARYRLRRAPYVVLNGPSECMPPNPDVGAPLRLLAQGTLAADRGLDEIIDAMHELRGTAHLTLQGYGPLEGHVRRRIAAEELDAVVRLADACAPDRVVACASAYDVGLVAIKPTCLNSELSTPNRLFAYLGAGLCVVASDIPAVSSIVRSAECGVVLPSLDKETIARAVRDLAGDPDRVATMKCRAAAACAEYAWSRQAEVLLEAVAGATTARGASHA